MAFSFIQSIFGNCKPCDTCHVSLSNFCGCCRKTNVFLIKRDSTHINCISGAKKDLSAILDILGDAGEEFKKAAVEKITNKKIEQIEQSQLDAGTMEIIKELAFLVLSGSGAMKKEEMKEEALARINCVLCFCEVEPDKLYSGEDSLPLNVVTELKKVAKKIAKHGSSAALLWKSFRSANINSLEDVKKQFMDLSEKQISFITEKTRPNFNNFFIRVTGASFYMELSAADKIVFEKAVNIKKKLNDIEEEFLYMAQDLWGCVKKCQIVSTVELKKSFLGLNSEQLAVFNEEEQRVATFFKRVQDAVCFDHLALIDKDIFLTIAKLTSAKAGDKLEMFFQWTQPVTGNFSLLSFLNETEEENSTPSTTSSESGFPITDLKRANIMNDSTNKLETVLSRLGGSLPAELPIEKRVREIIIRKRLDIICAIANINQKYLQDEPLLESIQDSLDAGSAELEHYDGAIFYLYQVLNVMSPETELKKSFLSSIVYDYFVTAKKKYPGFIAEMKKPDLLDVSVEYFKVLKDIARGYKAIELASFNSSFSLNSWCLKVRENYLELMKSKEQSFSRSDGSSELSSPAVQAVQPFPRQTQEEQDIPDSRAGASVSMPFWIRGERNEEPSIG